MSMRTMPTTRSGCCATIENDVRPPSEAPTSTTRGKPNSSSNGGIVAAKCSRPHRSSASGSESPWFGRSGASTWCVPRSALPSSSYMYAVCPPPWRQTTGGRDATDPIRGSGPAGRRRATNPLRPSVGTSWRGTRSSGWTSIDGSVMSSAFAGHAGRCGRSSAGASSLACSECRHRRSSSVQLRKHFLREQHHRLGCGVSIGAQRRSDDHEPVDPEIARAR